MTAFAGAPRLHVLASPGEYGRWEAVVHDVADLVNLEALLEPRPQGGDGPAEAEAILAAAAKMDGAVLVLPGGGGAAREVGPVAPRVRRVLVPFERSRAEGPVLRLLIRRALAKDMAVEQVHVLGEDNRPAMWEGSGHHAQEWLEELRREHQVGTALLRVRSGRTTDVLRSWAAEADLVVVEWGGKTGAERARVLRAILAGSPPPLLLLPAAAPKTGNT